MVMPSAGGVVNLNPNYGPVRAPLIQKVLAAKSNADPLNLCPFCGNSDGDPRREFWKKPDAEVDENGNCQHLIGWTRQEFVAERKYEPLLNVKGGRRMVQVKRDKILREGFDEHDGERKWDWGKAELETAHKDDQFLVLTASSIKVYRSEETRAKLAQVSEPKKK